nr:LysR substrate-binding domain-containing protein [Aeromicrobium sp. YIM 150415]
MTVGSDSLVVIVGPSHPWARRTDVLGASELFSTPLVLREPGSGARTSFDAAVAGHSAARPVAELPTDAAVMLNTEFGSAPGVVSRRSAQSAIADGNLIQVECDVFEHQELSAVWLQPWLLEDAAYRALVDIARTGKAHDSSAFAAR